MSPTPLAAAAAAVLLMILLLSAWMCILSRSTTAFAAACDTPTVGFWSGRSLPAFRSHGIEILPLAGLFLLIGYEQNKGAFNLALTGQSWSNPELVSPFPAALGSLALSVVWFRAETKRYNRQASSVEDFECSGMHV
eukprot:scaffold22680_cov107-Cylindrotheca_fusiformis.AAC.16